MNKSYASPPVEGSGPAINDGSEGSQKKRAARSFILPMLLGGAIAGTLDIGAASLINRSNPARILQAIAAGLLGKSSFDGGSGTVFLGLVLQLAMSILIAAIFVMAGQYWSKLKRHWVKAGLAYGVVIFVVMNYVVLPLSAIGHAPRFKVMHFMEDIVAMLSFGLIIAFFARERRNR